jgi:peptidyl-prolyl cis-trans isomerase D
MFATIRKHQKWLWLIVIVLVIIAFVILMDPTYSVTGGRILGEAGSFGTINGRPIAREELLETRDEVNLHFRLLTGRWPGEDETSRMWFNPDQRIHQRLVLLEKIRALDIQVDDAAVADWIARNFRDRDRDTFDLETYRLFAKNVLPQAGLTESDLRRFARNEVAIQHLIQLGSLSGSLVTPRDAELQFRLENERVSIQLAGFSLTNHLAEVIVDPDELHRFFTNRLAAYRVPERVEVSYARFEIADFHDAAEKQLADRPDLETLIEARYEQLGAEFFRDSDGNVLPPDAARERMREQERDRLAITAARQRAMSFIEELYELYQQEPDGRNLLERLAAAHGLPSGVTEPFAAQETPPELDVFRDFASAAFAIRPDLPMATEPIVGRDSVYAIALQRRLPSEVPDFESVEFRVAADYRRQEALKIAQERGRSFQTTLTNRLAESLSFQEACHEANVVWIQPPPISRKTTSVPGLGVDISAAQLKDLALRLQPGETSEFVSTSTGGTIIHVTERQPVDDAKLEAELAGYIEQLRQERQSEALSEWFRKLAETTVILGLPTFERR